MNRERHDRIGEVFLQARALTGQDRETYLDQACAADGVLRAEVASFLAADSQDTSPFLCDPALAGHGHGV